MVNCHIVHLSVLIVCKKLLCTDEVVFEFRPGNYLNILGSDEKPGVHGHFYVQIDQR